VREFFTKHKDGIVLLMLVMVGVALLSVSTDRASFRPADMLHSTAGLVQRVASGIGRFFANTVTSIRELSQLQSQYDALVEQVREAEGMADELVSLREENAQLRAVLEFSSSQSTRTIPARVIAKEPGAFFDGLTLNKGTRDGVRRNMAVIANQGGSQGLVGRIVQTGLSTSIVMPVFDTDSFVAARLLRSRHEGLVGGQGSGSELLSMAYVPKSARSEIGVGDRVITSGMQSIFPEGITLGYIDSIAGRGYETSLDLELRPAVDASRLEYVFVVGGEQ
jgi:rod shape-determining protein MreC